MYTKKTATKIYRLNVGTFAPLTKVPWNFYAQAKTLQDSKIGPIWCHETDKFILRENSRRVTATVRYFP